MASVGDPQKVSGSFQFLRDLSLYAVEKPYYIDGLLDPQVEHRRTNLEYCRKEVEINDARNWNPPARLNVNGFQLIRRPVKVRFSERPQQNEENVDSYLQDVASLLLQEFPGSRVFVFDYAVPFKSCPP